MHRSAHRTWRSLAISLLLQPEEDEEDNDGGGENAGGAGKARVGSSGELVRKEMYLVKWKNLSYLHNSWEMAAHLEV